MKVKLTAEEIEKEYCSKCANREKCKKKNTDVTKCWLSDL